MKRLGRLALIGVLAAATTAWGQQGGDTGGGNTGGGNTGGGNSGGGNQTNRGTQQQTDPFGTTSTVQQMPRPVYLSGKVVLSNGEIPPEPVTIERVCGGVTTPEAYTDTKGRFSFEVGGDPTLAISDASIAGGGGGFGRGGLGGGGFGGGGLRSDPTGMTVDMSGCDLRAALPGFISDQLPLGVRRALDNPDVGVISLTPLAGYGGAFISATSMEAPKKARAAYEKARREMTKKRGSDPQKVAKELDKAVSEYPKYASAWALLGETKLRMNDSAGARAAFQKSLEADPKYMRPYGPLLKLTVAEKDWPAIESLTDAALDISPSWTQARYYLAVAQFSQGRDDEALASIETISKSEGAADYPQTHQMIGMIESKRGSFDQAAQSFRTYLELAPDSSSADQIRKQLNEWEVLGVIQPAKVAAAQ